MTDTPLSILCGVTSSFDRKKWQLKFQPKLKQDGVANKERKRKKRKKKERKKKDRAKNKIN